jgi:type VI secretion system protein VasG
MEDGEGRQINFRNCLIILTTNAGTETIMKLTADPETMPFPDVMAKTLKPELDAVFKPAFLGRMVIVPYYPVRDENLKQIVRLKVGKIKRRLRETHRMEMLYDDTLISQVAARCTEVESGARNVDNILSNTLLPEISMMLLATMAEGSKPTAMRVGVGEDGNFTYEPVSDTVAV